MKVNLHFPIAGVLELMEHAENAPESKALYGDDTGPALWVVGDHGVYLMSNGEPALTRYEKDQVTKNKVVYARECNPDTMSFDEWWSAKRASFGGDDGADALTCAELREMLAAYERQDLKAESLRLGFAGGQMHVSFACEREAA